jgi:hypothetical protein
MKTFDLSSIKVKEVTAKQVKFAESLAVKTNSSLPSTSQILNYCEMDTMREIIEEMKAGNKICLS